jgi:hypothetical protein
MSAIFSSIKGRYYKIEIRFLTTLFLFLFVEEFFIKNLTTLFYPDLKSGQGMHV